MRRINTIFFLLTCLPGISQAAPVITDLTGTLSDNGAVTLTGTGFGAQGPTIHIYDNFEGGTAGADVDTTATVGTWSGYGTNKPSFDNLSGYSGNLSMRVFDGTVGENDTQIIQASFAPTTEFFVSYWLQIPAGTTFPGTDEPGKIPTLSTIPTFGTSTWKLVWIFDEQGYLATCAPSCTSSGFTQDNDIVLPTHVGGQLGIKGNNTNAPFGDLQLTAASSNFDQLDSIFRFGQWVRMSVWIKANETDPLLPGSTVWTYSIPTANINVTKTNFTNQVFCGPPTVSCPSGGTKPPYQWTLMNFTGFTGNGRPDWSQTHPLFDEVYLATGPGAQARIEICEAPVFSDCDKFGYITVASPANWNDTTITGVIQKGALADAEVQRSFAYVYDKDGSVNATGFPLCPNCALPPTNLQAE